jgi:hypothetical protein
VQLLETLLLAGSVCLRIYLISSFFTARCVKKLWHRRDSSSSGFRILRTFEVVFIFFLKSHAFPLWAARIRLFPPKKVHSFRKRVSLASILQFLSEATDAIFLLLDQWDARIMRSVYHGKMCNVSGI